MKKKRKELIYVVIILVSIGIFLLYPYSVDADFGWDNNYSFSLFSFDDSIFRNSSSSWDYRLNSSDKDVFFGMIILFIIVMILSIYFIRKNYRKNQKRKSLEHGSLNQEHVKMEEKVKKVIPNFNLEEFKNTVFKKYKEIQIARMDFDYDTLRKNCTDSLYHMYRSQLEILKLKRQKNIMNHFRQITFRVVGIEQDHQEVSLKVRTTIWCYDYIVDEEEHVVKGSKNKKSIYNYEMLFIRRIQENNNKRLSCDSLMKNQNSVVCPYCDGEIIDDRNFDWILSKQDMISQK